jgi:uncharacterized lipoprotein YddW (UPF0748 family)
MRLVPWLPVVQRVRAFGVLGVTLILLLSNRAASTMASAPEAAASETRGLWVVRTSLSSPDRIAAMVRAAERGGFNTILVQVRGRGDAYYRSAIEPRSADLDGQPAAFDPLALTLDLAHRAGIRVHAWVAVNLVASSVTLPESPNHVVNRHPEWLMVPAPLARSLHGMRPASPAYKEALARWTRGEADQVEGLYLSPVSAEARQYTLGVVKDLVSKYAIDGIHFDYIRYPGLAFDYSAGSIAAFRTKQSPATAVAERERLDRLTRTDPAAWPTALPQAWEAFRRDQLTTLVHALAGMVRSVRPRIAISAAVVPRSEEARTRRLQDWPRWAAAGDLDALCPMAYVTDEHEFGGLVTRARAAAGRVPIWAGIGAFRIPAADAVRQIHAAREAGASGVVIFSYDSVTGSTALSAGYLEELRPALVGRTP